MAKVICITRSGKQCEREEVYERCKEIFDEYMDVTNADRVKHWKEGWLYDYDNHLMGHVKNMTQDEAIFYLNRFREIIGREFADEDEIIKATGLSKDRLKQITTAWIAFDLSERQGGCWVF